MSNGKKQTMNWDAATNQKLLLAILAHHGELKFDNNGIATLMGPLCSPRAVQEQIKKLRKDARAGFDETNQTFPGAQATPDKRASSKTPRTIAAPADKEPVNAKAKANEEDSRKKRKFHHPAVIDADGSAIKDFTTAEAMYASGAAFEELG